MSDPISQLEQALQDQKNLKPVEHVIARSEETKVVKPKVIKPKTERLKPEHELFCQAFSKDRDCFGNGVAAYQKVYPKSSYKAARVGAHRLLTHDNIVKRVRYLVDIYISDEVADKELGVVMLQYGDLHAKVAAIKEYNQLKGRVIKKVANLNMDFMDLLGTVNQKGKDYSG